MTVIDRSTYPDWFNTRSGVGPDSPYKDDAQRWNAELTWGHLDTEGIKQRVYANAHQQNIYLESVELRLEAQETSTAGADEINANLAALKFEMEAVRASSTEEFSDVFNDKITALWDRAHADHVNSDDDGTGANRRRP